MTKKEQFKELFNEFDLDVKDEYDNDEFYRIYIDDCFLFLNHENDDVYLTFDASTRPDYSANIVALIKNNLDFVNDIFISDLYYNMCDETLFGDDAYNKFINDLTNEVINDYQQQIDEFEMLKNFEPSVIH